MHELSTLHPPGPAPPPEFVHWWRYARGCAYALRNGEPPPTLRVYGPVLWDGESALLCAPAFYSRFFGGDGEYNPSAMYVVGRPAVMIGALAAQGLINHRRRVAAEREAATRWRLHQGVEVIVTTHRLLCHTRADGWLAFPFDRVTEFYPDLQSWELTMTFGGATAPLRLAGPSTPALSLWSAYGILGRNWVTDPRLAPLLQ
jgi:hypothetical protein